MRSSSFNCTANFLSLSKSVSSWVTSWPLNRGPGIVFDFFSSNTVCILRMFWHAWHTWWVSLWRRYCYFNIFWIHFSHWWFTSLFTFRIFCCVLFCCTATFFSAHCFFFCVLFYNVHDQNFARGSPLLSTVSCLRQNQIQMRKSSVVNKQQGARFFGSNGIRTTTENTSRFANLIAGIFIPGSMTDTGDNVNRLSKYP